MWSALAASLVLTAGVKGADDAGYPFSVAVNLTGWSAQVFQENWEMDPKTGSMSFTNRSFPADEVDVMRAVGDYIAPHGSIRGVDYNTTWFRSWWGSEIESKRWQYVDSPVPATGALTVFDNDGYRDWHLSLAGVVESIATVVIDYITLQIPIRTKAPSEEVLRAGAHSVSTVKEGKVDTGVFKFRDFDSQEYLDSISGGRVSRFAAVPPKHVDVINGSAVFSFYTELVYNVPPHTSLINVTGPVFESPSAGCYAILHPEPWWWTTAILPKVKPAKPEYRANQTLMLLPVDPSVTYQLIVGAMGNDTLCSVSGITTYAYEEEAPAGSNGTTGASGSTDGSSAKSSNAGAIAGGVVGGVAGLLLIGLAAFFLIRRRRRQHTQATSEKPFAALPNYEPTEDVQIIVPYVGGDHGSPVISTADRSDSADGYFGAASDKRHDIISSPEDTFWAEASSSAGSSRPWPSPGGVGDDDSPGIRRGIRRGIRQHEDTEDVEEELPPRYKETWGQRAQVDVPDEIPVAVVRPEKNGSRAKDGLSPS